MLPLKRAHSSTFCIPGTALSALFTSPHFILTILSSQVPYYLFPLICTHRETESQRRNVTCPIYPCVWASRAHSFHSTVSQGLKKPKIPQASPPLLMFVLSTMSFSSGCWLVYLQEQGTHSHSMHSISLFRQHQCRGLLNSSVELRDIKRISKQISK